MLAQSMASVVLAAEALFRATPDVFFDTTGFAFSFPVAWLAGCSVGAYVHYPTISMVREEQPFALETWIDCIVQKRLQLAVYTEVKSFSGTRTTAVRVQQ